MHWCVVQKRYKRKQNVVYVDYPPHCTTMIVMSIIMHRAIIRLYGVSHGGVISSRYRTKMR